MTSACLSAAKRIFAATRTAATLALAFFAFSTALSAIPAQKPVTQIATDTRYGAPNGANISIGGTMTNPFGIAIDAAGNYYVSDTGNSSVIKYTPGGTATYVITQGQLIAGTALNPGSLPIAIDSSNNLFIGDYNNHRVIRVPSGGTPVVMIANTTLINGNTLGAIPGLAVDNTNGFLYVADSSRIIQIAYNPSTGATTSFSSFPTGTKVPTAVAVGPTGLFYYAAYDQSTFIPSVYRQNSNGTTTTLIQSIDSSPFTTGMVIDSSSNIFLTDQGAVGFVEEFPAGGTYTAATYANFALQPISADTNTNGGSSGIAIDPLGRIVVTNNISSTTDTTHPYFARYNPPGPLTFPTASVATTSAPQTLTFSIAAGTVISNVSYLTQGIAGKDFKILANDPAVICAAGSYSITTVCAVHITFTPQGPGLRKGAFVFYDIAGKPLATVYLSGIGTGPLGAFDPGTPSTILGINDGTGNPSPNTSTGDNGFATSATIKSPVALAVDPQGRVLVADLNSTALRQFIPGGFVAPIGAGIVTNAGGIALDGAGNIFASDRSTNQIVEIVNQNGAYSAPVTIAGGGSVSSPFSATTRGAQALLAQPYGVAVDASGNVFFTDLVANTLNEVNVATGVISVVAGGGANASVSTAISPPTAGVFLQPRGLDIDASGNIYVADTNDNAIRKINSTLTTMTTVAGTGTLNYSGDTGPATSATLNAPQDVTIDAAGNLFIADSGNRVIRQVQSSGNIITLVGNGAPGFSAEGSLPVFFRTPASVRLDPLGNLYIGDSGNHVVRAINRSTPLYNFATTTIGLTSTDSPANFTLSNVGNSVLSITVPSGAGATNPTLFGTAKASYTLSNTGTCPQLTTSSSIATLAASASCNFAISFKPTLATNAGFFRFIDTSYAGGSQLLTLSGTGNPPPVTAFVLSGLPTSGTSTIAIPFTVTAMNGNAVATTYTGTVTISSAQDIYTGFGAPNGTATYTFTAADNGVHTFTSATGVTFGKAGADTFTLTDSVANVSVTSPIINIVPGPPTGLSLFKVSSPQSATVGSAFASPLKAIVGDGWGNNTPNIVLTFVAPAAIALSSPTCTTDSTGTCSVTATAKNPASSTPYAVSISVPGIAGSQAFALTIIPASPTLTVTAAPTTLVYGQPLTLTATSSIPSAGGVSPTGIVVFFDNLAPLVPIATPVQGVATLTTAATVGAHTFGASSAADTNFNAAPFTTATPLTVAKAPPTVTITTIPQVTVNSSTAQVTGTITPPFTGLNISLPSGTVLCNYFTPINFFLAASNGTVTPGTTNSTYTCSIPATITATPGSYIVNVFYNGDTNFTSTNGTGANFQVGQLTPTVTYPAQTAITYGAALTNNLNATTAYTTTSLTAGGTTTYTATLGTGNPVAVTTATVLSPGTYTLTATWTPNAANATLYKTVTGTTTLVVNPAALTVTANSISILFGQARPAYTATITGFVNGDTTATATTGAPALSTTPAAPTAVGTYAITPAIGTLAATNYTFVTFAPANLIIAKAAGGISAITQTAPLPSGTVGVGVPATFTVLATDATTGSTGTPTGTVQFFNGATALGSPITVTGTGSASLNTTFATAQTASITAVYSGDANFTGATSAVFTETVVTPGFSVTANPTSITITRGTAAAATITFTPVGNYQGTALMNCTGLPAYSSCIFNPSSLTFTGNNAVQTSTLQIFTLAPTAQAAHAGLLWVPAILLGMLLWFRRRNLPLAGRALLLMLVMACAALGLNGCGGASAATPTGTDTLTVNVTATATAGSGSSNLNQTATITITIQ